MALTIGNGFKHSYVSPEKSVVLTSDNKAAVKNQNTAAASQKPKLPAISNSVDFTALGCDTEHKLAQAAWMAAAAKAGIADENAQRAFANQMIALNSANLSVLKPGKKDVALDDKSVKARLLNQSVQFKLEKSDVAALENFRNEYRESGGKIRFNKTPTIDLRGEPGVVGSKNIADLPAAPATIKLKVFLDGKGNPTDPARILAQHSKDTYGSGNLWADNHVRIAEMSIGQGVKPKIIKVTQAGDKNLVEFTLSPLDRAKISENYKIVQTEVNRARAVYEDFANNNEVSSFLRGAFNGALNSIKGTIGLLNVPETMKALWQIVSNPQETFNALSKELNETWVEFKNAPPNKKSEMIGEVVGAGIVEILLGKGIGKAGSILAKTKTGTEILEKAKLAQTATAAKIAETFSDEAASAAATRLRGRLQATTLYAGIPADALADLAVISANKINNGAVKFSDFAKQMVDEVGEKVKPKLLELYQESFEKVFGARKTLTLDELLGGHSIEKHVGKSESWLRQRLLNEPDTELASSFKNYETASRTIGKAITENSAKIEEWFSEGKAKLIIRTEMNENVGIVLERGKGGSVGLKTAKETNKAEIIIIRDNTPQGWHVLTSYPSN